VTDFEDLVCMEKCQFSLPLNVKARGKFMNKKELFK
jgi:hypothetical protein